MSDVSTNEEVLGMNYFKQQWVFYASHAFV